MDKKRPISWETYPNQAAAQFQGHTLKVNESKRGGYDALVDGNFIAPQFTFETMDQARAACEQAARKLPPK